MSEVSCIQLMMWKNPPLSGMDKSLFHNRRTQLPNPTSVGQWLVLTHSTHPAPENKLPSFQDSNQCTVVFLVHFPNRVNLQNFAKASWFCYIISSMWGSRDMGIVITLSCSFLVYEEMGSFLCEHDQTKGIHANAPSLHVKRVCLVSVDVY